MKSELKSIFTMTLAICAILGTSAQAQWNPKTSCGALGGYELENCLANELVTADSALNAAYKRAEDMVAASQTGADQKKAWLDKFVTAQRAWIAFRDANCNFDLIGAEFNFGSATTASQQECTLEMIQQRTQELQNRYQTSK